ncbi:MAG: hypothetical protein C0605_06395 [Hyphomicrobiales bacterium]|nr:MAG: hypothetical protein C0605_06395 [Hyphomicrobiales bacterium]
MAMARSWEAANGLPKEIQAILGKNSELLLAIPEHKVPLPGGRRESQCDVFALVAIADRIASVAVEGKVNEPFGPTIGDWLIRPTPGRIKRLTTICEMLGGAYPPPPELRYQLFHRTAAALIEAGRFNTDSAAMIVHSFSQEHRWYDDFHAFCSYLGLEGERGKAVPKQLPDGRELILGWATGDRRYIEPE